ncbi:23S rRNA pseudouridine(1911/1915/1917) synthase RluD [Cocleimonas flava]|nr:23S rRNA pseudouridine(1911/1915/1917) synthase RluD [Cocleimonas flava]
MSNNESDVEQNAEDLSKMNADSSADNSMENITENSTDNRTDNSTENNQIVFSIPEEYLGDRLDRVVAELCPQFSRSQLQKWIKSGDIRINNKVANVRDKVIGGEEVIVTPVLQQQTYDLPEAIKLDIVYEDDHLLVINKPAGLVVHPGAGNQTGTLVNGLLAHNSAQENLPRAGIVHRLDKDTTGLMMVAKTLETHTALVNQLQEREVKREYLALVCKEVIAGDTIEANIGRHPQDRKKMTVLTSGGGKTAITHYRVEQKLLHHTLLRVNLETGRTHQIRVHLAWRHMPILGDRVYGGRSRVPANIDGELREQLQKMNRQSLHATRLTIIHPHTEEEMSWQVDMPADMQLLVDRLQIDKYE